MRDQDTLPTGIHPEAALLPWYINGTLNAEDRQRVSEHLVACSPCRAELDELTHLHEDLQAVYAAQPGPSARVERWVKDRVARDAHRSSPAAPSLPDRVDRWCRSLLLPQWAPTLAVILVAAQLGMIVWLTMAPMVPQEVRTRSVGAPTVRFEIAFLPDSTEAQIRSVLSMVQGHITNGPTEQGIYTIDVLADDPDTAAQKLDLLRRQAEVVRAVTAHRP